MSDMNDSNSSNNSNEAWGESSWDEALAWEDGDWMDPRWYFHCDDENDVIHLREKVPMMVTLANGMVDCINVQTITVFGEEGLTDYVSVLMGRQMTDGTYAVRTMTISDPTMLAEYIVELTKALAQIDPRVAAGIRKFGEGDGDSNG